MASEYTTHYNLDLYTDTDKPNLRDQYNGAMNKIDSQLNTLSNNIVISTEAANQAKEQAKAASDAAAANAQSISTLKNTVSGIDTAYKAADSSITDAYKAADTKLYSDITAAYKAADSALSSSKAPVNHASSDTTYGAGDATHYGHVKLYNTLSTNADGAVTPAAVQSALSNINTSIGDGSITTQKIADGAVTAAKIAQSAKDAIMGGMTIKIFGNKITGTDNTGASYPTGCEMAGAYIPALDILIIWKIHILANSGWSSTKPLVLPSYVPSMHTNPAGDAQFSVGGIEWTSENYFKSWYGIIIDGRKVYVSSTINDNFDSVPIVMSCAPFRDGYTSILTS